MSKTAQNTRFARSPASSLSGVELFANVVWHRSKAKLMGVLTWRYSKTLVDPLRSRCFPPEIVEMIIAHLKYDTPALKACAATCFSWYNIASRHLHRTLILWEWTSSKYRNKRPNPLPLLFKLGLLSCVQDLQFKGTFTAGRWFCPAVFDPQNMRHFRAMENLQALTIAGLDFLKFPAGLGEYLGHFAPTLRSMALSGPVGTRQQLLDFFRLFPKLDDLEISSYDTRRDGYGVPDAQLAPINGGLRGRLTLSVFGEEALLEDIIVAFGAMRFTSMDLRHARGMEFLLKTCANTLETLRIYPEDVFSPCYSVFDPVYSRLQDFDLSSNCALRSIEIPLSSLDFAKPVLATITSPVFTEIVVIFSEAGADRSTEGLAREIRELYEIREFTVAFCLEASEKSRIGHQRRLTRETGQMVAAGHYSFLSCPPSVFSRTL